MDEEGGRRGWTTKDEDEEEDGEKEASRSPGIEENGRGRRSRKRARATRSVASPSRAGPSCYLGVVTLTPHALQESPEERLVELSELKQKGRPDVVLVHEVYTSIQGESTHAGRPCTFIRTTGCHLRCRYCDTEHAFHQGVERPIDELVATVRARGVPLVELTGGEPLLQKSALALVTRLLDEGFEVLIETSGGVSVEGVDPRARLILDIKTPGSGEDRKNVWKNLERLKPGHDEVKVVICDEADYAWARDVIATRPIPAGVTVLFSPSYPGMPAAALAEQILRDRLPVRFQVQLHKVLWGEKPGV